MNRIKEIRYFALVMFLFCFLGAMAVTSCREQKKKENTEQTEAPDAAAEGEEHPEGGEHPEGEEHPEGGEHPEGEEHPEGGEHPEGEEHPKDSVQ